MERTERIEGEPSRAEHIEAEHEVDDLVLIRCVLCGAEEMYPRRNVVGYGAVIGRTCTRCGGWYIAEIGEEVE